MPEEEEIRNEQMEEDPTSPVYNLVSAYNLLVESYDMLDKGMIGKVRDKRFRGMIEKLEDKMAEAIDKL